MIYLIKLHSNFHRILLGQKSIWFSYDSPIAFKRDDESPVMMCHNKWGTTTAKHMKEIEANYTCLHVDEETFLDELRFITW
jgi:hypothetical protein